MRVIVSGCTGHMGRILQDRIAAGFCGAEYAGGINSAARLRDLDVPADVVIDFSNHAGTAALLEDAVARNLPVLVATTGHTPEEKAAIEAAAEKIPVFFAANTSVGVAVLGDLVKRAAAMFPEADIEIIERHHNRKADAPSGTALVLARKIQEVRPEAEFVIGRHEAGKRKPQDIGIHALRYGNEVGTHEVIISNGAETITLKHEAESRELFANGALTAAAFLMGKPAGLYGMADLLK